MFALSGLLGCAVFLFASRNLREHGAPTASAGPSLRFWSNYRRLLASREYLAFLVFGSCMVSMIYTFVTGAPYVAIDVLGVSPARFGLLLFFPALASFAGFIVAARLTGRIGGQRMMRTGAMIALAGTVSMAAFAVAGIWHPLAVFVPGMLIGFANAIAAPSSTIGAISRDPAIAGAASGLLGFLQLVTAAVATQIVAAFTGALAGAAVGGVAGAVPGRALRAQADRKSRIAASGQPQGRPVDVAADAIAEAHGAEGHEVAVLELRVAHLDAVHEHAVAAVRIHHHRLAAAQRQHRVQAADGRVDDAQVVVVRAADVDAVAGDLVHLADQIDADQVAAQRAASSRGRRRTRPAARG